MAITRFRRWSNNERSLSLSLTEARDALKAKKTSSAELTEAYIGAMESGKSLNAFITETPDKARAMAKASDEKLAKGEGGAMEGLPIGIKDLFCTEGVLTTAASHILDGFKPEYESTVSQNLWNAGGVMLGKLNLDEFAMAPRTRAAITARLKTRGAVPAAITRNWFRAALPAAPLLPCPAVSPLPQPAPIQAARSASLPACAVLSA